MPIENRQIILPKAVHVDGVKNLYGALLVHKDQWSHNKLATLLRQLCRLLRIDRKVGYTVAAVNSSVVSLANQKAAIREIYGYRFAPRIVDEAHYAGELAFLYRSAEFRCRFV